EIMKQIPVYDGSTYSNILQAFLYKVSEDGKVTWNSHGSTSGTAIAVATDAITMSEAGKSLQEIQQELAKKYG
ncbi:PCYCGC motif-containing (lipo)protein, partial [Acinetobacter baumannii]|uniref:PCYCGC motif-containing (lipo)protein n=1 Tax=Acinetobacter baumannii TaxID=470 RepID=UPI000A6C8D6E